MATIFLRIELATGVRLGPGKALLMEMIEKHGSISAAGRALDMSYRRAWLLVDSLNEAFNEPVVATTLGGRGGGKAELTAFGRELLEQYRRMEEEARQTLAPRLATVEKNLRPQSGGQRKASA